MSKNRNVTIKCPRCEYQTDFQVWENIDTSIDPEMIQKVKDGSLFRYTCPQCGVTSALHFSLLYHDPEKKLMVYYVNSEEEAETVASIFGGDMSDTAKAAADGYTMRIVLSSEQLREKIFISDAGYDDRIIEIMKVLVISQLRETYPEFDAELIFYRDKDGVDCFQFVGGNTEATGVDLAPGMYEKAEEAYASLLAGSSADEYFINRAWALDFLNNSQGK